MKHVLRYIKTILKSLGLLPFVKRILAPHAGTSTVDNRAANLSYLIRVAAEHATYAGCTNVHELPEIFHYWSNKHLRPKFEVCGFSHPDTFFSLYLEKTLNRDLSRPRRFISIGSGNCDTEVRVAKLLLEKGHSNFTIECLDINADMLRRGKTLAEESGVGAQIIPLKGDFNAWYPQHKYDAIVANQSLHHVLKLEHVFDAIQDGLLPDGRFITSDMIGRNGHLRWPEAKEIVDEFWEELPESYRYNQQLKRHEQKYLDRDCSVDGFEGIRAQDVLPLLADRFHFEFFAAFANAIDPFIGRSFGHNFNVQADWDRNFIDRIHARDDAEIIAGRIKPTHMFAVMGNERSSDPYFLGGLDPESCVRHPTG